MSFRPGKSGNKAGRPKGSKNKFKVIVKESCEKLGVNPAEILCYMAKGYAPIRHPSTDQVEFEKLTNHKFQLDATTELMSYLQPKLKQIEHITKNEDARPQIIVAGLNGNLAEELQALVSKQNDESRNRELDEDEE